MRRCRHAVDAADAETVKRLLVCNEEDESSDEDSPPSDAPTPREHWATQFMTRTGYTTIPLSKKATKKFQSPATIADAVSRGFRVEPYDRG